jgi:hypothetical protein
LYEDTVYIFGAADFEQITAEVPKIRIVKPVTAGSLTLEGSEIGLSEISVADIQSGSLIFTPNDDFNNVSGGYPNFQFRVYDSETEAYTPEVCTMTITVIPVNDPPSGDDGEVMLTDDGSYVFNISDFKFEDDRDRDVPEQGESNDFAMIKITALEQKGDLEFNGEDVYVGQVISVPDIAAGKFTYKAEYPVGKHFDNFHFRVGDELAEEGNGWSDDYIMWLNAGDPPNLECQFVWDDDMTRGTVIGSITCSEESGIVRYEVAGGTGQGIFHVNPETGVITVAEGAVLDTDMTDSYTLDIRVYDARGLTAETVITIHVRSINPVIDLDEDDDGEDSPGGNTGTPPYDFAVSWTAEPGVPVYLADKDAILSEPEGHNFISLTAAITNMKDGDILAADTSGTGITANYNPETGILTLAGTDTPANYTNVLRRITFSNTKDKPESEERVVEFVASDDDGEYTPIATCRIYIEPAAVSAKETDGTSNCFIGTVSRATIFP